MQDQYFEYYMENVQRSQIINQQRQIDQLLGLREASLATVSTGEGGDGDDSAGEGFSLLRPGFGWLKHPLVRIPLYKLMIFAMIYR